MDQILVTGASGFVGQNLVSYLSTIFNCKSVNRVELQTVSPLMFDQALAVVHLAGKAHDLRKTSAPEEYYAVNYELTKKVYDAFLKSDAKKFIFVSSVKAAADNVDEILTEDDLPRPQTHYGKSKLLAEKYIQSQPLPVGKSYYILRPCMIHGPGNKGNLSLLYQVVKKNLPYPLAAFANKRSFLTVKNLCFVVKEMLDRDDIPSDAYNLADDEPLSTNTVIQILSRSLNKKARLWAVSPSVIKFIAKIGDLLNLPLTTERLQKLTENFVVSNAKIKKALHKDLPCTAVQGMLETARSFNPQQK